jgi:glycerate kinase
LRPPQNVRLFREIIVAVDVQNRLLGPRGATRVYGPQKGLKPTDFIRAEQCLNQLRLVAQAYRKCPMAREPGTGAAGGLGFGLRCFLDAQLRPGFELFARYAKLSRRLRSVQLVLTGEGAIDRSTLMGKGVGEIATYCRKARIPCIGLAGIIGNPSMVQRRFSQVHAMAPTLTSLENAHSNPSSWLQKLTETVALGYSSNH